MSAVNLTDFLLARIAEDEAVASNARPQDGDSEERDYDRASWHEAHCGYGMGEFYAECDCDVPARVLAECEAKRRIVENSQTLSRHGSGRVVAPELQWVLATLALPYADHADYREAWRP